MITIITLAAFIIWYFNSIIGIILVGLIISYHAWIYFGTTKSTKKIMSIKEKEINHVFNGNNQHYNYLMTNSFFFLYPAAARKFAKDCNAIIFLSIILIVISVFKTNWINIVFGVIYIVLSWYLIEKYIKPTIDHKKQGSVSFYLNEYNQFIEIYWNTISKKWKA